MRYAIIKDGKVVNVVELDKHSDWEPPEGELVKLNVEDRVDSRWERDPDTGEFYCREPQTGSVVDPRIGLADRLNALIELLDELFGQARIGSISKDTVTDRAKAIRDRRLRPIPVDDSDEPVRGLGR